MFLFANELQVTFGDCRIPDASTVHLLVWIPLLWRRSWPSRMFVWYGVSWRGRLVHNCSEMQIDVPIAVTQWSIAVFSLFRFSSCWCPKWRTRCGKKRCSTPNVVRSWTSRCFVPSLQQCRRLLPLFIYNVGYLETWRMDGHRPRGAPGFPMWIRDLQQVAETCCIMLGRKGGKNCMTCISVLKWLEI